MISSVWDSGGTCSVIERSHVFSSFSKSWLTLAACPRIGFRPRLSLSSPLFPASAGFLPTVTISNKNLYLESSRGLPYNGHLKPLCVYTDGVNASRGVHPGDQNNDAKRHSSELSHTAGAFHGSITNGIA